MKITLIIIFAIVVVAAVAVPRSRGDSYSYNTQRPATDQDNREWRRNRQLHSELFRSSSRGDLEHIDKAMDAMNDVVGEFECKEISRKNKDKLKTLTNQIRRTNSMSRKMGSEFRKENRSILRRLQRMIKSIDSGKPHLGL